VPASEFPLGTAPFSQSSLFGGMKNGYIATNFAADFSLYPKSPAET
jgi:hypothetical protein